MKDHYSILIPIHNEANSIPYLLKELKPYAKNGHEIIIINDGSTDKSIDLLNQCDFINLLSLEKNKGKGTAVRYGLSIAKNDSIITFDGDMELLTKNISRLMILNKKKEVNCVCGNRFNEIQKLLNIWNIGNLFFSFLFNFINKTNLKDVLCCAKSFYKKDLDLKKLKSKKFDIDIEILSMLVKKYDTIITIPLEYKRRTKKQGKKLSIFDSWIIFKRMINIIKN